MVPGWAIDTGFFLGFIVGLSVIVMTFLRPPTDNSGSGTLTLWHSSFQFTGRAIFQLFIGALLVVFPVLLAAASRPVDIAPRSRNYTLVPTIKDPSYRAFHFLRDTSILDLRSMGHSSFLNGWRMFGGKSNPANLTNDMRILKVDPSDVISFTYSTSGKLDVRCLTQKYSLKKVEKDQHNGIGMEQWEVTMDVSDVPVGSEFEVIIEATYWNAFDKPEKQWYATYANDQTAAETLATLILFPTDKPFNNYSLEAYPHGSSQGQLFAGASKTVPGSDKLSFYWEIPNAQGDNTYEVHWN